MAFTVQTLPPTAGANAYITAAFFREYHADRGRDYSDTTDHPDTTVQAWIVQASQYADVRFGYVGYRYSADQTTEWPRSSAYNDRGDRVVGIPLALQQAVAEYALRAQSGDLLADPERDGSGQEVKSKSETVGPISERIEYVEYGGLVMPIYPLADNILKAAGLIESGGASGGLSSGNLGRA